MNKEDRLSVVEILVDVLSKDVGMNKTVVVLCAINLCLLSASSFFGFRFAIVPLVISTILVIYSYNQRDKVAK